MGCTNSKTILPRRRKTEEQTVECDNKENVDGSDNAIIGQYDREMVKTIKKDLDNNPDLFVLNNVLMATIFQKNYYHEVSDALQTIEDSTTEFVEPDIFLEKINKNVIYRPLHGISKDNAEPLVTKRMYVPMNEYIQVYNPMDDQEGEIDNDKFHVRMEKSSRTGYVKLRQVNKSTPGDHHSIKDMLTVPSSSNSGSSDTESSDQTSLEGSNATPQLIKDEQDEYRLQDCLVFRKVKKEDVDIMLEELDHDNLTDEDVYDVVGYLNSRTFMKFFQSKIFKSSIGKEIGLLQFQIDDAYVLQHSPGKVFCNVLNNDGDTCPVEVIPCLRISWPERETYDFVNRDTNEDEKDNLWPNSEIIQKLRRQNCVLVPRGYSKKPGDYPEGDLEWEINFPYAERYLECLLRPEQIKCYLILLALHKEYIQEFTGKRGVLPEHYKTLIFHEAERSYDGWPEHRLGIKYMRVFNNFSKALQNRTFKDYFIRKKNLFKNGSRSHMERANEVFHQIIQSPLMMILRVLRNIRYTTGNYYPPLDYKVLLEILYRKDWEGDDFFKIYREEAMSVVSGVSSRKQPKFADAEKQLRYAKHKKEKQHIVNNLKKKENLKRSTSYSVKLVRRDSTDSIDDDWNCEKNFHRQKKIALLKFFIRNFLDIAQTSSKIGTRRQTLFYIKQAGYLVKILDEENELFKEEVDEIAHEIKLKEEECINIMIGNVEKYGNEDEAAVKSVRDDSENKNGKIYGSKTNIHLDIHQQIRQRKINLKSLSRSYSRAFSYNGNVNDDVEENDLYPNT